MVKYITCQLICGVYLWEKSLIGWTIYNSHNNKIMNAFKHKSVVKWKQMIVIKYLFCKMHINKKQKFLFEFLFDRFSFQ